MNYSGVALNSTVSRSNWNLEMLVFAEGGKPEYPEKNPQSRDENQQQTQPTYCMTTETRAILVGGECSHHCTIPAPSGIGITFLMKVKIKIFQPQKAKCLAKSWLCIETKQNKTNNQTHIKFGPSGLMLFAFDIIMHQSIPALPIPPPPPRADPWELTFFENELANAPPPGQKSCSNAQG